MLLSHHTIVTTTWILLSLLPLFGAALVWLLFESPFWGFLLAILYPLYFIPYGFFVSMPLMVLIFRKPASLHRR